MSSIPSLGMVALLGVAPLGCANLVAQQVSLPVRLTNLAPAPRTQWVDVAVPKADGDALPRVCRVTPYGWIAIKGEDVGIHSTLFHVLARTTGSDSRAGTLQPAAQAPIPPFRLSRWIDDNLNRVFPRPFAYTAHGATEPLIGETTELVSSNEVRQVWRHRGRIRNTPLRWESHLYMYTEQDTIRFECTITNCDLNSPSLTYRINQLWLEGGEYIGLDYRTRLGIGEPFATPASGSTPAGWTQWLSGARDLGRGESLYFTGHVLPLPDGGYQPRGWIYRVGNTQRVVNIQHRLESIGASLQGPLVGVSHDWEGKWLAFGHPPEIPHGHGNGWAEADARHAAFMTQLSWRGDLYDNRPLGLNKHARTTGAQEDFGAAKGTTAIRVGDPRYIYHAFYSMSEFMRPFHNRENDNSYLLRRQHPGLQTWDQVINCRTTTDYLGLTCPLPYAWPNSGFGGIDDQHRSQNNFHALLALTGSYMLKGCLQDYLEIDQTQVPGWMGEPRAVGRLFMAWASMHELLDDAQDRARLRAHMIAKLATVESQWLGRPFLGNPSRPIRAVDTGTDPTFHEPNGQLVNAIITWEHSIAVMGLYAAFKVTGNTRYRDLAREVATTIANHCCFQENGQWYCCTAIRYRTGAQEGAPLPASSYVSSGSQDLIVNNGFWVWVLPSIQILDEIGGHPQGFQARLDSILQTVAPNGPTTWADACWWAAVDW